ncbi:MAG: nucleotidyltransferase family protein [Firmicutes bacterium]|jgi:molybdenum cofactor cytidylyltransferase|nr:nucleotidyltransferase family protein [Bacillota bacterium]
MIGAIILAAGESKRMGTLKQVLPWGDKTVIEASVDAACNAPGVSQVVTVLGHEAARIRAVLDKESRPKLRLTLNPDYKSGMFSSVKAGISSLDPRIEAFFVAPADQPEIQPEVYEKILEVFRRQGQSDDIVIPVYQGRGGHPTLFRAALRSEIMSMPYDGNGLRDVIRKHEDRVFRVNMEYSGIIYDLDTKEDYHRAMYRRTRHDSST